MSAFFTVFRSRRMAVLTGLGFSSGLPLLLTGQTLGYWLTKEKVSLATIGAFAAVSLPYSIKFLWAPFLDRYTLPRFGRRRGWALVFQALLVVAIAAMGTCDPVSARGTLAVLAVVVATLSASQDIVLDAYKADLLGSDERAAGAAVFVLGYRLAMLVAGTAAFMLSDWIPWRIIYFGFAALMIPGMVLTALAEEPATAGPPRTLGKAIVEPFRRLCARQGILIAIAFIAIYKFGEQIASTMTNPLLSRALGFSGTEIGLFNKIFGFAGTVLGGVLAGGAVPKLGMKRSLLIFGALQAGTNLCYAGLATLGHSMPGLAIAVTVDNVANAMGTGAFVAFLMSLCDRETSATQYALLISLSTLLGRALGWVAGPLVESLGWPLFFAATAAMAIPGLIVGLKLRPVRD